MKNFLLSATLCFAVATAFAQTPLQEKIESENVVAAEITKGGKTTQGYLRKMSAYEDGKTYPAPWMYQGTIRFMPKDLFESTEKIKNKMYEKYDAKDLDGYKFDTLTYESVKYADMSAVGTGMFAKQIFMRKIKDDKISLYQHFDTPPSVVSGSGFAPYYIECAKPHTVYRIGEDDKLKLVENMNVEKEIEDCPTVLEKYKNGEYQVVGSNEDGPSGANKLLNKALFAGSIKMMVIEDYNENCQ